MNCSRLVSIRSFATSSVSLELIKTPVQVYGVEGRYASALYSAAFKSKSLDNVEKDLKGIQDLIKTNNKFREFIGNPTIKKDVKQEALLLVGDTAKVCESTKNLLSALVDNRRLSKLSGVVSSFGTLMAAHRGEVVCEVTTAKTLDGPMKSELEASLKAFLKKGEVLQYTLKVDPSIIGGMKITIGDKYIDMSIASKINKYSAAISSPV